MKTELGFRLKEQGLVNVDLAVHESHGNAHVDVLKLRVIVVGHLTVEFVVAVLETKLQSKDSEVPGLRKGRFNRVSSQEDVRSCFEKKRDPLPAYHSKAKAVLQLLHDLVRQQGHMPSTVQLNGRTHREHDVKSVVVVELLGQGLVDTLHVCRQGLDIELAVPSELDEIANRQGYFASLLRHGFLRDSE